MPEYLITFNDEWVAEHTPDQLRDKAARSRAVLDEMREVGVLVYTNGGIDLDNVVCSVEAVDGEPVFSDGPYVESKEHLGGFCLVDVADEAEAREWAGKLAVALEWPQEVIAFPRPGHRPDVRPEYVGRDA